MASNMSQLRPPRRRSMLPQFTQAKQTRQLEKGERSPVETTLEQSTSPAKTSHIVRDDNHAMPPPSSVRRSSRLSMNPGTKGVQPIDSRRMPVARSMSSSGETPPVKARSASVTRNIPPSIKQPSHNRSVSHQMTVRPPAPKPDRIQPPRHDRRPSLRPQKPSFDMYKQHYTPTKSSPRSTTGIRSTSKDTSSARRPSISTDAPATSRPPAPPPPELIHLHYLHSLATPTLTAWTRSAESHFRTRFSDLGHRSSELHAIASEQQGLLNALALTEWGAGIPSAVIGEKVEALSRDIGELEGMIQPEGKFERVGRVWEVWFFEAEEVREGRKGAREDSAANTTVDGGGFVEGIGDGWKAEAMVLERELGYVRRDLEAFGEVKEESGLGRLVRLSKSLCDGLVAELDVMQWIEDEVMREEGEWMEEMVGNLTKGVSAGMSL